MLTWEQAMKKHEGMEVDDTAYPVIYFISAKGKPRHPVKIGRSTTKAVQQRLVTLQIGSPLPLEFLAVWQTQTDMERIVHQHLADLRVRGEWFRRGKALIDFIKAVENDQPNWRRDLGAIRLRYRLSASTGANGGN